MEKVSSFIKKIYEFYKTKNGKRIFFFGFYLVFFIMIGVFISSISESDQKPVDEFDSYTTSLLSLDNNYHYVYKVVENDQEIVFEGYRDNENLLLNEYKYNYFLNFFNVNQMIKHAKFINKTEYDNKDMELYYEIETGELMTLLEKDMECVSEKVNTIKVIRNSDIKTVVLDLSDYISYIDNSITNYQITLGYNMEEDNNE